MRSTVLRVQEYITATKTLLLLVCIEMVYFVPQLFSTAQLWFTTEFEPNHYFSHLSYIQKLGKPILSVKEQNRWIHIWLEKNLLTKF